MCAKSRSGDDVTAVTVHGRLSSRPKGRADSVPVRRIRPGIRVVLGGTSTVSGSRRLIPNTATSGGAVCVALAGSPAAVYSSTIPRSRLRVSRRRRQNEASGRRRRQSRARAGLAEGSGGHLRGAGGHLGRRALRPEGTWVESRWMAGPTGRR